MCKSYEGVRSVAILLLVGLLTAGLGVSTAQADRAERSLAGQWRFRLDPEDVGVKEQWFDKTLPERIKLPGSLQEQGFGHEVSVDTEWTGGIVDRSWFTDPKYAKYREPGNVKVPFWLQPEKHYVGAAWYQRDITIPPEWRGRRVRLHLERPHWATRVWIDGRDLGTKDSLSTPHVYDLETEPGQHRLTIRVDNRMIVNVGINAHSVSDHTQSNWNGIVGRLALTARSPIWIEDVQVFPDAARKAARVKVRIANDTGKAARGKLTLSAKAFNTDTAYEAPAKTSSVDVTAQGTTVEAVYLLGEKAPLWDEFSPALFRLTADLEIVADGQSSKDRRAVTFGLREIRVDGTQFTINGRKSFIRGTLECCIFPLTGYPPTDSEHWKKNIRIAKAHGLNTLRFHSWCPPEAAFVAADELGCYLQVECGAWAAIGQGKPIDTWLYAEADRILQAYGNHPSFTMMAYGNEPGGRHKQYLTQWLKHYKAKDDRRVYTGAAGWPAIAENQYHNVPQPRVQHWGAGLSSRINAKPPETRADYSDHVRKAEVPIVSHEIGQWCVYPNFEEIAKYTGVLKAKNFEIFRDTLRANHMGDQARDFLMASGKLQTLCYKEDIESALRTEGFGGFHLLDLHDFPGQGTALVGVLDAFWGEKGYVSAAEYRRFCNSTVPLARMDKRYWRTSETFYADIEVAHFGPAPLRDATAAWKVVAEQGRSIMRGQLRKRTISIGSPIPLGVIKVPLRQVKPPAKLTLTVGIKDTPFENDWDVWVFADRLPTAEARDVLVRKRLDDAARQRLEAGGKVLLIAPAAEVDSDVAIGFSSIFWNTAWTRNQPPHTLGILCDPRHPVFAHFPTASHSDWQWWELIHGSAAMILDGLPPRLRPLVQPIDTWFENRRLGLLFEARVLGGKLMVCSMDLDSDLKGRLVARQMRYSLLQYMAGEQFAPSHELTVEQVESLFGTPTMVQRLEAQVTADSHQPGYEAKLAIDGNAETIWHTRWGPPLDPHPHHLILDLRKPVLLSGLTCLPRDDMANGRIARFEVRVSSGGKEWGPPVAQGTWPNDAKRKTIRFKRPIRARFVKLVSLSEVKGQGYTSLAEIDVIVPTPEGVD